MDERSQRYDSKTNSVAERGVQSVEDMARVLRISLETKLGAVIPIGHPIMAWIVPHSAFLLNVLEVGHDGRTAYERLWENLTGGKWLRSVIRFYSE